MNIISDEEEEEMLIRCKNCNTLMRLSDERLHSFTCAEAVFSPSPTPSSPYTSPHYPASPLLSHASSPCASSPSPQARRLVPTPLLPPGVFSAVDPDTLLIPVDAWRLREGPLDSDSAGWLPDSAAQQCQKCSAQFDFFTRRHHCRNCGGLFCADCSSHRLDRDYLSRPPMLTPPPPSLSLASITTVLSHVLSASSIYEAPLPPVHAPSGELESNHADPLSIHHDSHLDSKSHESNLSSSSSSSNLSSSNLSLSLSSPSLPSVTSSSSSSSSSYSLSTPSFSTSHSSNTNNNNNNNTFSTMAWIGQYHLALLSPSLASHPPCFGRVCDGCFERALGMSLMDFFKEKETQRGAQHLRLHAMLRRFPPLPLPPLLSLLDATPGPFVALAACEARAPDGETPLHIAAQYRHLRAAVAMVNRGHPLEPRRRHQSMTPLHVAVAYRALGAVGLLLDLGANPWAATLSGRTAAQLYDDAYEKKQDNVHNHHHDNEDDHNGNNNNNNEDENHHHSDKEIERQKQQYVEDAIVKLLLSRSVKKNPKLPVPESLADYWQQQEDNLAAEIDYHLRKNKKMN